MMIMAVRDADSTDLIEVKVPAEGFLRRELYFGRSRTVVTGTVVTDSRSTCFGSIPAAANRAA